MRNQARRHSRALKVETNGVAWVVVVLVVVRVVVVVVVVVVAGIRGGLWRYRRS